MVEIRTVATGAAASVQVQPATASAFGLDNDAHAGSDSGAAGAIRVEGKDPGAYARPSAASHQPSALSVHARTWPPVRMPYKSDG